MIDYSDKELEKLIDIVKEGDLSVKIFTEDVLEKGRYVAGEFAEAGFNIKRQASGGFTALFQNSRVEILSIHTDTERLHGWAGDIVAYYTPPPNYLRDFNLMRLMVKQGREVFLYHPREGEIQ